MKFGATTIMSGGFAAATATDAASNGEPWDGEFTIIWRSTTTVVVQATVRTANSTGTVAMTPWGLTSQMGAVTVGTTAQALDVLSAWSAANASNSITTNWSTVEVLN